MRHTKRNVICRIFDFSSTFRELPFRMVLIIITEGLFNLLLYMLTANKEKIMDIVTI